jgi:hypothetical protein
MKFIGIGIFVFIFVVGFYLTQNDSGSAKANDNIITFKAEERVNFQATHSLHNEGAYVTSQCYTKTVDAQGGKHNPCFACHINSEAPNYINDPDLQTAYDVGEYTKTNRFTNLFKDRTEAVNVIGDDEILHYVRQDNYLNSANEIVIAKKLKSVPSVWDVNGNKQWDGYMPDCYFNFDTEGFDKAPNGGLTGWRAFAYYPFLGTFWPTNRSTDDVLIRLPKVFREDANGKEDVTVYKVNLAIVEALIKKRDVSIAPVDEQLLGVDLDLDGELGTTNKVSYKWEKPSYDLVTGLISGFSMHYVGKAKELLLSNEYLIAPGFYPKGTEFLHTVRYIDVDEVGNIKMAKRMKELRYMKKEAWNSYHQLHNAAISEIKEKDAFPDRLRTIKGNTEEGLNNSLGWVLQGFIENSQGELRPQNYEETQFCIGCHSGIGAITDATFAFGRKLEGEAWYHWTQRPNGLKGVEEPRGKDGSFEYTRYLELNHAGDEFRDNEEVMQKFFNEDGSLNQAEVSQIHTNIAHLLYPSRARALKLNKAYKVIVDEQSYIYGRDAHVEPVENVHREVEVGQSTELEAVTF